ncbi:MAG: hypothetical protein ACLUI3_02625 [Christensenellales bacterium]
MRSRRQRSVAPWTPDGDFCALLQASRGRRENIIVNVRLPRDERRAGRRVAVPCGAAMQGFSNPLADGSTLGVSAGILGVDALALGVTIPGRITVNDARGDGVWCSVVDADSPWPTR